MPVVSRTGRIAMGNHPELSVDGRVLIPDGIWGRQWLNDQEVMTSEGVVLVSVNADTGEVRPLHDYGANSFYAGGGVWASWVGYNPHDPTYEWGYCDSHGMTDWDNGVKVRDWHPIAVDDLTGTIVLYENGSQAVGVAFWDGITRRQIYPGSLYPAVKSFHDGEYAGTLLDQTVRVWKLDGNYRDLPTSRLWGCALSHGVRVGFYDNAFLSVCREGETWGLILSRDAYNFNADILTTTTALVATSWGDGELANEIRRYVVNLEARTVNGVPTPWVNLAAPLPPDPPIPPIPPIPPVPPDPPDPPVPPIPPIPPLPPVVRPVPLELLMADGSFTIAKSQLQLNTPGDVVDPIFVGPTYYHVTLPTGGFLSYDLGTGTFKPLGAPKVGPSENFQWTKDENVCLLNMGLPFDVRSFVVSMHL